MGRLPTLEEEYPKAMLFIKILLIFNMIMFYILYFGGMIILIRNS